MSLFIFLIIGLYSYSPLALSNDIVFHKAYHTAQQHSKSLKPHQSTTQYIHDHFPAHAKASYSALVNLNIANAKTLQNLPNIGTKRAAHIIAYRNQLPRQRFESVEQLLNIKGINKKRLERIRAYVMIEPT